jgi:hypothetical protein
MSKEPRVPSCWRAFLCPCRGRVEVSPLPRVALRSTRGYIPTPRPGRSRAATSAVLEAKAWAGFGFSVLGVGRWALGVGRRAFGVRRWALGVRRTQHAPEGRRCVATGGAQRNPWGAVRSVRVMRCSAVCPGKGHRDVERTSGLVVLTGVPLPLPGQGGGEPVSTRCATLHTWLHSDAPAGAFGGGDFGGVGGLSPLDMPRQASNIRHRTSAVGHSTSLYLPSTSTGSHFRPHCRARSWESK